MPELNTRNVHQRLAAAMEEVKYIQKEKKAGMRYSIISHDVVTAKVRPALLAQGVVYYPTAIQFNQNGNRTEVQLDVTFVNVDDPNDRFTVPSLGYGIDDSDKGPGKAISYAVKYALLKALGLETGDDPDEDQASVHDASAEPAAKKPRVGKAKAATAAELLSLIETTEGAAELEALKPKVTALKNAGDTEGYEKAKAALLKRLS